jgi:dihydrolipoamide dehydrogenase
MSVTNQQVVVIGAGPGGYAATFRAADRGLNVTLIDPAENPGGTCLYRGCIPTKALLHINQLLQETKHSAKWGIIFNEPEIDLDKVREWKDSVVNKLTTGLGQLTKQRKVEYIRGLARFVDENTLEIDLVDGEKKKLAFENAIIATGTESMPVPGIDLKSDRLLNSTTALDITGIPETMLVIGAGYIGLEMATIYKGLGSKVSLVELTDGLMPGTDRDLVKIYEKYNKGLFEETMLETKVIGMKEVKDGIEVEMEQKDGNKTKKKYSKVLAAIGRKPNTDNIGLENAAIKKNDKGIIEVDKQRRTNVQNIFAIGDITGNPMLAHKAMHEGIVAAEVIAGHKRAFEPQVIPGVLFTDPEIAFCGMSEEQATKEELNLETAKFPWAASGRALTLDRTEGMTKLLIDPETDRVRGVGIIGSDAGKLISEGALAIEMAALASDLALTIHPHPTLSETIMEAAEVYYGHCTHLYKPKKK